MKWSMVYERAIMDDGSLLFPEKLTHEFLDNAKRTMGSYIYANQYLNEIIPLDKQSFKKEWFKYYDSLPENKNTFIFIDPALSEADTADNTGIVVNHVTHDNEWYIPYARRHRITPTQLVDFIFKLNDEYKPNIIAIEAIAYQKALLYFLDEEMRRRKVILPVKGIKYPNQNSKQTRILSLVPRFEWGHIYLNRGLTDLEMELLTFPRGGHDDLIDALAGMEYIAYPPDKEKLWVKEPGPQHKQYESWYLHQLHKRQKEDSIQETD